MPAEVEHNRHIVIVSVQLIPARINRSIVLLLNGIVGRERARVFIIWKRVLRDFSLLDFSLHVLCAQAYLLQWMLDIFLK